MDKPVYELYHRGERIKIYDNGFFEISKDSLPTEANVCINRLLQYAHEYAMNYEAAFGKLEKSKMTRVYENDIYYSYLRNQTKQEKSMTTYCGIPLAVLHESYMKQHEKPNMTRQEAVQAAKCYGINNPEAHIKMLEELGLLKFEEEKKELSVIEIISSHCHSKLANAIIADLEKSGYRIVKLGKMTKFNEGAISWSIRLDDISQEQS